MNRVKLLCATASIALLGLAGSASSAVAAPIWQAQPDANTFVAPGDTLRYNFVAANVGDEPTSGEYRALITLPAGITAVAKEGTGGWGCTGNGPGPAPGILGASTVACTRSQEVAPGHLTQPVGALIIATSVDAGASGPLTADFEIAGGGATLLDGSPCGQFDSAPDPFEPPCATAVKTTTVSTDPPQFGIEAFDSRATADRLGNAFTQAGGHPYAITTQIDLNTAQDPTFGQVYPVEPPKDILVDLPPGLIGNTTGLAQCKLEELMDTFSTGGRPSCPPASQVGLVTLRTANGGAAIPPFQIYGTDGLGPIFLYNMTPPTGAPARFGMNIATTVVVLDPELRSDGDYGITVGTRNTSEALPVIGTDITFWGSPGDPSHDAQRWCPQTSELGCSVGGAVKPLLRMPTSCPPVGQGLTTTLRTNSWEHPGVFDEKSIKYRQPPGYPTDPQDWGPVAGLSECQDIRVKGSLDAQPTALDTETPSGLSVKVEVPNSGLELDGGISSSDIKAVKVTLPEGVTINPSQAEGLGVCKPDQYESTELSFFPTPGKGCPSDSKIGTVLVHTPLLEEAIEGDVYIAQQDDPRTTQHGAENPFDSLLAIYMVLHNPQRGILIKLAGEVETDEQTGRIVTSFDDIPQLPFSSFELKLREGARAPLVTPPMCGTYTTQALFTPWSDLSRRLESNSTFEIVHGIGGGPCPAGGVPPFHPGFTAGALNNNAGSYSPFTMRLTRQDGEQDMTKFSSVLPPGVSAKIAGVSKCPEAAIAIAKAKTGREEQASPSCPANSEIGHIMAGAGVGSVLTYVGGKVYLAGPYNGAPLSAVVITPAVAGPFDVGTVITREALDLDPKTAVVHVDGDKSDPIPHILEGIPLKVRDLRVYVDRPEFTINPTSCDPSQVGATLFGSFLDVLSPADDVPVGLASRYQAANCSALAFKPRLSIKLKGGTKRGGHPALKAVLTPRRGDANLSEAVVTLPNSAFLDQGHIRTVCTRVQYAAKACPPGSVYGHVRAWTPLLDEPLEGPAYLRSSNHKLPDLVFALHGVVDIETAGRIDSVNGGIRASFEGIPDAPISKAVIEMQGGKKGLVINSTDLCASANRAKARFTGQNGKVLSFEPVVRPVGCSKGRRGHRGRGTR